MEKTDNLENNLKEAFVSFVDAVGLAVWIKIVTESPDCTYYFGPFSSLVEAEALKTGYVEDLESEAATIKTLSTKRCKPLDLTIFDESLDFSHDNSNDGRKLILSGQPS